MKRRTKAFSILETLPEESVNMRSANLLEAEQIFTVSVGTNSTYLRSVYAYLNNLHARWRKSDRALEYKEKYLSLRVKQINE